MSIQRSSQNGKNDEDKENSGQEKGKAYRTNSEPREVVLHRFYHIMVSFILKKLALIILCQHYTGKVIQWKQVQRRDQVGKEKLNF
jgi:hypothetical protein